MSAFEEANILKLNNPELDRKMGGLPLPSLTLVEGANDSGKTIIIQQFTYGGHLQLVKKYCISPLRIPQKDCSITWSGLTGRSPTITLLESSGSLR